MVEISVGRSLSNREAEVMIERHIIAQRALKSLEESEGKCILPKLFTPQIVCRNAFSRGSVGLVFSSEIDKIALHRISDVEIVFRAINGDYDRKEINIGEDSLDKKLCNLRKNKGTIVVIPYTEGFSGKSFPGRYNLYVYDS